MWTNISGEVADIHMRTDAKNLVATARTVHLRGQFIYVDNRKQSKLFPCCGRKPGPGTEAFCERIRLKDTVLEFL